MSSRVHTIVPTRTSLGQVRLLTIAVRQVGWWWTGYDTGARGDALWTVLGRSGVIDFLTRVTALSIADDPSHLRGYRRRRSGEHSNTLCEHRGLTAEPELFQITTASCPDLVSPEILPIAGVLAKEADS